MATISHGNRRVFAGALALSFAFGSLHAFGILLEPLQHWLGSDRADVSLGYSLAIVSLTSGVFATRFVALILTPRLLALTCGVVGAGGLLLAASGIGLSGFLIGYGLVFGLCNGLAYNLFLERSAAALPMAGGAAIGSATAVYGFGATVFTLILGWAVSHATVSIAFCIMAASVALAGVMAAAAFSPASGVATAKPATLLPDSAPSASLLRMWLIYFLGAGGGLMVIAHATAIMTGSHADPALAQTATTLNAAGNVAGSLLGGWLADRLTARRALGTPLLLLALAFCCLLIDPPGWLMAAMLALCGFAYGALIAIVPVIVRAEFGAAAFARKFGVVFTAWGFAGLLGPVLAGWLFDLQGHYRFAIVLALAAALAAQFVNFRTARRIAV